MGILHRNILFQLSAIFALRSKAAPEAKLVRDVAFIESLVSTTDNDWIRAYLCNAKT